MVECTDEFFVMLTTQPGGITPLTDEDGELVIFASAAAAEEAAQGSVLGHHFGFEVFKRGHGE